MSRKRHWNRYADRMNRLPPPELPEGATVLWEDEDGDLLVLVGHSIAIFDAHGEMEGEVFIGGNRVPLLQRLMAEALGKPVPPAWLQRPETPLEATEEVMTAQEPSVDSEAREKYNHSTRRAVLGLEWDELTDDARQRWVTFATEARTQYSRFDPWTGDKVR